MNLQPRENDDDVEINITPLIDVVFLLLIFFMVSTTFIHKSQINLNLPQASEDIVEVEIEKVRVAVDRDGRYYINDRALVNTQMTTLKQGLSDATGTLHDPVIIVSADADATHQAVIQVLDAARQLDLVRITFVTEIKDEETD